jgi:hypothetical protein
MLRCVSTLEFVRIPQKYKGILIPVQIVSPIFPIQVTALFLTRIELLITTLRSLITRLGSLDYLPLNARMLDEVVDSVVDVLVNEVNIHYLLWVVWRL